MLQSTTACRATSQSQDSLARSGHELKLSKFIQHKSAKETKPTCPSETPDGITHGNRMLACAGGHGSLFLVSWAESPSRAFCTDARLSSCCAASSVSAGEAPLFQ